MTRYGDAMALLASLVLEDGRRWGEAAADFQWADARAVLGDEGPRQHYQTRPRGASKTGDAAGTAVAAMLEQLPPGARAYAVAADRDQARLLVDSIDGYVARTPELAGALKVDSYRVSAVRKGVVLETLAADGPSAYGLRPHLIVVDELAQWADTPGPKRVWEAVYSSVPKVPGCRLVVLTSAGDPVHWSARILASAKASSRWRVHEVPGPCPWIDPATLEEQRAVLTESQYARLHLNQWTAPEDRLTTIDDLAACVTLDGPLEPVRGQDYVVALDVGLVNDRTVAVVCHAERVPGGRRRVVLDRIKVWAGSHRDRVDLDRVEGWVATASEMYAGVPANFGGSPVAYDAYQAEQLTQRLRKRNVPTVQATFSRAANSHRALLLHGLIRSHLLALPDDPDLLDELANVRLRETSPGVYRLDHEADRHDDRAVALAMAAAHLLEGGPSGASFVMTPAPAGSNLMQVDF